VTSAWKSAIAAFPADNVDCRWAPVPGDCAWT
jgi:hypothetical protein